MDNDSESTGLFDKRITLGNVITIVMGLAAVVSVTWQVTRFADDVTGRLSALESKVGEIDGKLDRWHHSEHLGSTQ